MIATIPTRRRLPPGILLALACAACGNQGHRPAAPETAPPAPTPVASTPEDRGQQQAGKPAAPSDDQGAFSHVDSGESERAASQRGHDSAGKPALGT